MWQCYSCQTYTPTKIDTICDNCNILVYPGEVGEIHYLVPVQELSELNMDNSRLSGLARKHKDRADHLETELREAEGLLRDARMDTPNKYEGLTRDEANDRLETKKQEWLSKNQRLVGTKKNTGAPND